MTMILLKKNKNDLAASFQKTVIDMLLDKLILVSKNENLSQLAIAGGVAANSELRSRLEVLAKENNWKVFIPEFQYCTDNAGMIAISGYLLHKMGIKGNIEEIPLPRMPF